MSDTESQLDAVLKDIHAMRGDFTKFAEKLTCLTEVMIRKEEQDKFLETRFVEFVGNVKEMEKSHAKQIKELQLKSVGTESAKKIGGLIVVAILTAVFVGGLGLYQYGKTSTHQVAGK